MQGRVFLNCSSPAPVWALAAGASFPPRAQRGLCLGAVTPRWLSPVWAMTERPAQHKGLPSLSWAQPLPQQSGLDRDRARTAELSGAEGCSVWHNAMPSNNKLLVFLPRMSITQWLAGHSSASGGAEWLPVHRLFLFLFALLLKLYCSQPISFLIFALPFLSPCQWGGGRRAASTWVGAQLLDEANPP